MQNKIQFEIVGLTPQGAYFKPTRPVLNARRTLTNKLSSKRPSFKANKKSFVQYADPQSISMQ
jgi:hypothetical protein